MGGVPPTHGAARLNELLDQIRHEFETQMRSVQRRREGIEVDFRS